MSRRTSSDSDGRWADFDCWRGAWTVRDVKASVTRRTTYQADPCEHHQPSDRSRGHTSRLPKSFLFNSLSRCRCIFGRRLCSSARRPN
jgi:hypothetical protein